MRALVLQVGIRRNDEGFAWVSLNGVGGEGEGYDTWRAELEGSAFL